VKPLLYFALGFGAVFLLKYVVFGLVAWNAALHPNRVEEPRLLAIFGKPFLGVFG
jgi:hypothetical protein